MSTFLKNPVFYDMDADQMYQAFDDKRLIDIDDVDQFDANINSMDLWGEGLKENIEKPGFYDVTALSLVMDETSELGTVAKLLPEFSQLHSIIFEYDVDFDISVFLEEVPQLENLLVWDEHKISPTRHTGIRQLCSERNDLTEMLQVCSFPNLEVLEVAEPSKPFADVFNQIGFTKLTHFGFMDTEPTDQLNVLKMMNMPSSLKSLLLDGESHGKHIKKLSQLPFSANLSHLTLRGTELDSAKYLSAEYFPQLQFLKWLPWEEEDIPEFFFDDSLSHLKAIDLRFMGIRDELGERLLQSPIMKTLDIMYLDFNHIVDTELVDAFNRLPCAVSLIGQEEGEDYDEESYE